MAVPNFVARMRAMNMAPEPPRENPNEAARISWEKLHDYATKALALAHETNDANRTLSAQLDSLSRENERLADENARVNRELRGTAAYAQSLRTRLTTLREQIEIAERESLEYAQHAMTVAPETAEDREGAARMADNITRLTPGTTMPPPNAFPVVAR